MQRPVTCALCDESLASLTSRSFPVSFRDRGGRMLVSTPSIQWFDCRHHMSICPRRLSFMKLRRCPVSSLTITCIFMGLSTHPKKESLHVGLAKTLTAKYGTRRLANAFSNILGGWNPTCSDWGYTNIYTRCWRTIFATLAWKYGIQQVSQMSTGIPRMDVSGYCKAWWKDGWSGRRLFWVPASQVQGTSVYFEHWLRGPKFQQSWTCLTQGSAESGQNASTRSGWESSSKRKSGRAAGVKNKVRPVLTTCTWRCSNMWE